jgi:hypothetical protein
MGYLLSYEVYNKNKSELTLSRENSGEASLKKCQDMSQENSLEVSREEQAGSSGG